MNKSVHLPILLSMVLLVGCTLAKVDVNVVSERTSLENQVLGSYNSLSEDLLLVASVRGVSPSGKIDAPPRRSPEHRDALNALETISFHADDLESFKRLKWVGENRDGLITPFTRAIPPNLPTDLKAFSTLYSDAEFNQVVSEINGARELLFLRVVQTNENFTVKDIPAIRKIFADLNRQNSAPGTRVQGDDGRWVER
jgi:hypothetical protein